MTARSRKNDDGAYTPVSLRTEHWVMKNLGVGRTFLKQLRQPAYHDDRPPLTYYQLHQGRGSPILYDVAELEAHIRTYCAQVGTPAEQATDEDLLDEERGPLVLNPFDHQEDTQ